MKNLLATKVKNLAIIIFSFLIVTACKQNSPSGNENGNGSETYNLKVKAWKVFRYKEPINTIWESKKEIRLIDKDGRTFTVKDGRLSRNFIYDESSLEVWDEGLRVTWEGNGTPISVIFPATDSTERGYDVITTNLQDGRNYGVNPKSHVNKITEAAFVVEFTNLSGWKDLEKVTDIEIKHNDEWIPMTTDERCFENIKKGESTFHSFVTLKNLDLEEEFIIRAKGDYNNEYEYSVETSIAPFYEVQNNGFVVEPPDCRSSDLLVNLIQLDIQKFLKNFKESRTENYLPLPTVGDTLEYISSFHEEGSEALLDYHLVPFDIITFPDTTIHFKRFRYWEEATIWPYPSETARIDTVTMRIQNKRIETLNFFPKIDNTADSLHTHYPADYENPHTVNIYNIPFTENPPWDITYVTLAKEKGIVRITRYNRPSDMYLYTYSTYLPGYEE